MKSTREENAMQDDLIWFWPECPPLPTQTGRRRDRSAEWDVLGAELAAEIALSTVPLPKGMTILCAANHRGAVDDRPRRVGRYTVEATAWTEALDRLGYRMPQPRIDAERIGSSFQRLLAGETLAEIRPNLPRRQISPAVSARVKAGIERYSANHS